MMVTETFDRPFDVQRWCEHPELINCVADLIREIEAQEARENARSERVQRVFRQSVRTLALDLYVAWKTNPDLEVGIARGKSAFLPGGRLARLYFSYQPFIDAFNGLVSLGYIQITREGRHDDESDFGKVTRAIASPKLISRLSRVPLCAIGANPKLTNIYLRDAKGNDTEYRATKFTKELTANLAKINARLASHWYDLEVSDVEFAKLAARIRKRESVERRAIDFTQRTLHRVFNLDWEQGGRFYGGWWQHVPREYRKFITIDDKETAELDYSGLHPMLVYRREGKDAPADPYDPEFIGVKKTNVDAASTRAKQRNVIKLTFNALLNAAKPEVRNEVDGFSPDLMGTSWTELQQCIISAHAPIRHRFGTEYGRYLQREDSDIAERVMLRFAQMPYPCLPVHDSFIVHHELAEDLAQVMREEFDLGSSGTIHIQVKAKPRRPTLDGTGLVDPDIGDLTKHASKYDERLQEWDLYRASQAPLLNNS